MVPNMESKVDYIFGDKLPVPLEPIEVAEGILWFRLPMPIALDHINIYLLDDGDSWILIDTGLADTKSIEIWMPLGIGILSDLLNLLVPQRRQVGIKIDLKLMISSKDDFLKKISFYIISF